MRVSRLNHVWENLDDDDFLLKLGAISRGEDEKLHPTTAGLLMFGFEHEIVREYPNYFLDYQENFSPSLRWTDRITSTSGEWSGNLFGFYHMAYNKLIQNPNIKIPFNLLDIGERAGSGIPNIYRVWEMYAWGRPCLSEKLEKTERVVIRLPISGGCIEANDKKVAIKK